VVIIIVHLQAKFQRPAFCSCSASRLVSHRRLPRHRNNGRHPYCRAQPSN